MSLNPSSTTQHHPLISSRPNSPGEPSTSYLVPSRTDSPSGGLTPRRRRGGAQSSASSEPAATPPLDDEDDKKQSGLRHTPLHRIESFFGLDEAARSTPPPRRPPASATSTLSAGSQQPQTRLVLQHTVATTDTLQSLALRYKTDVPTLRRVNGLWPGDSVLSRKILWVPLDKCKDLATREDAKVGTFEGGSVVEATPSALGLKGGASSISNSGPGSHVNGSLNGGAARSTPSASGPSTSLSRSRSTSPSQSLSHSRSASQSQSNSHSPPVVRRLPSEVLGHFPAAPRSDVLAKGKAKAADQWDDEVTSARPKHKLGPGPGMAGFRPGESGLEDLLGRDEEESRVQGPLQMGGKTPMLGSKEPRSSTPSSQSPSRPASPPVDEWKPNIWHMGSGGSNKESEATGSAPSAAQPPQESPTKGLRPLRLVDQSIQEWSDRQANSSATSSANTGGAGYQGWNDVPTLEAYAKGRVAEAYGATSSGKGKKAGGRAARAHHRFIDDLAAGLPANTGAASKWARPIGDSMPTAAAAAASKASPQQRAGQGGAPGLLNGSGVGLRSLLSDALRGRMGLDEALSKGFEEVLNRTEAWETLPREELEHARRVGAWPAASGVTPTAIPARLQQQQGAGGYGEGRPRISAEEARRSLGRSAGRAVARDGQAGGSSADGLDNGSVMSGDSAVGSGGPPRRKSQHEMATLGPPPARPGGPMQRRGSRNNVSQENSDLGTGRWGW